MATLAYGTRLYLCGDDNAAHAARLVLRDRLRDAPELASRYEALKRPLAEQANGDCDIYTHGKRAFIDEVLATTETKKAPPLPAGPLY